MSDDQLAELILRERAEWVECSIARELHEKAQSKWFATSQALKEEQFRRKVEAKIRKEFAIG